MIEDGTGITGGKHISLWTTCLTQQKNQAGAPPDFLEPVGFEVDTANPNWLLLQSINTILKSVGLKCYALPTVGSSAFG
jgi:hypothetical protein